MDNIDLTSFDTDINYNQPLVHSLKTAKTSKATPKQPTFFNGWVGTGSNKGDPYVSGYAFIKWLRIPNWIDKALALTANKDMSFAAYSEKNFKSLSGLSNIELEFDAIKAGFSQNETMFAKSLGQKSSEISIKYQEHSGGGLKAYYDAWITGIRDPKTNVATYPKRFGIPYHHNNHTGTLLYVVTRPDADNWLAAKGEDNIIEFAAIFTGIVPTTINIEHFNFESGNHEFVENEQKFKCYMHMGSKVEEIAYTVMANNHYLFAHEDSFVDIGSIDDLDGTNKQTNSTFPLGSFGLSSSGSKTPQTIDSIVSESTSYAEQAQKTNTKTTTA